MRSNALKKWIALGMLCNEGQIDVLTSGFHQLEVAFSNQPRGF